MHGLWHRLVSVDFVCDIASDSRGPIIGWAKVHATHL